MVFLQSSLFLTVKRLSDKNIFYICENVKFASNEEKVKRRERGRERRKREGEK